NKEGSIKVMEHHIGSIKSDEEASLIWDQLHDSFGAEVPADLFREILESRRLTMIAARQWPADKPLPDPEQFLARSLLESTLKERNCVPPNTAPQPNPNENRLFVCSALRPPAARPLFEEPDEPGHDQRQACEYD